MTFDSTVCATYRYDMIVNTNQIQITFKNITVLDLVNRKIRLIYMYTENFSVQYFS